MKAIPDNYPALRRKMVREQIAARGIRDARVLGAMEKIPRHLFVDENLRGRAYEDYPLPIAEGQTISQPYMVALMTECLELKGTEKVLEIGTGAGYQTAVLAELAKEVFTVEFFPKLMEKAEAVLKDLGYGNIKFKTGDGHAGWEKHAPYDAVIVTCAAAEPPPALLEQLAEGGRLIAPLGGRPQTLTLYAKTRDGIQKRGITSVMFVPMLKKSGEEN